MGEKNVTGGGAEAHSGNVLRGWVRVKEGPREDFCLAQWEGQGTPICPYPAVFPLASFCPSLGPDSDKKTLPCLTL